MAIHLTQIVLGSIYYDFCKLVIVALIFYSKKVINKFG